MDGHSRQKKKVVNVMIWADFRVEGRERRHYPDGAHTLLFGMLERRLVSALAMPSSMAGH
jgi:hypothetical protein